MFVVRRHLFIIPRRMSSFSSGSPSAPICAPREADTCVEHAEVHLQHTDTRVEHAIMPFETTDTYNENVTRHLGETERVVGTTSMRSQTTDGDARRPSGVREHERVVLRTTE
jgi:hypothetical protein